MDPYYQDDHVTLYHGDCMEITQWVSADVLVTDPPYGMAFRSGQRTERIDRQGQLSARFDKIAGDENPGIRDDALGMWGDRPAVVFGTWRIPRPSATRQVLIWHKHGAGPGMGDLNSAFGTSHEEIYVLGKWERVARRRGSVITTESSPSALTSKIGHPTPKPVGVMEILIECAPPGVIADPFSGSGSTLLAARNLGRRAIGVELEEQYCEIIAKRLDQMSLDFGGAS
jgi:site-specific DNA-methyltransferase (adenine-specific)